MRVVIDDDVDRMQVYVWRHIQPSITNCPNGFFSQGVFFELYRLGDGFVSLACAIVMYIKNEDKEIQVAIASGFHLFPFRTEKLSPTAPMVLPRWESRSLPF